MAADRIIKTGITRFFCLICTGLLLLPMIVFTARLVIFAGQARIVATLGGDHEELIQMVFTPDQFLQLHFERNGRELVLDETYYDIHSVDLFEGKYIIRALKDKNETRLMSGFDGQHRKEVSNQPRSCRVIFLAYYQVIDTFRAEGPPETGFCKWSWSAEIYDNPDMMTDTPPPKTIDSLN